jgi:hypothetical protein
MGGSPFRNRRPVGDMQKIRATRLQQILTVLACAVILKVIAGVLLSYRGYLPPNFESVFLQGREDYFSGSYQWAFYSHIFSGPCSLFIGLILLNKNFRQRYPNKHRYLGRIQAASILLLVAPSGLWMAFHAETGVIAGLGFASLAIATGICVSFGWRSAVNGRFAEHRQWMWRCYLLLCSAVVLRIMGGLATVAAVEGEWAYQTASWTSWLLPLGVFELIQLRARNCNRRSL